MTGMGSSLTARGVGGRDRVQQMGGIGDGRDVMDYRLQFPG